MGDEDYIDSSEREQISSDSPCIYQSQYEKPPSTLPSRIAPHCEEVCDGPTHRLPPKENPNPNISEDLTRTMKVVEKPPDAKDMELASNRNLLMAVNQQKQSNLHWLAAKTNDSRVIQQVFTTLRGSSTFERDLMQANYYGHTPLHMSIFRNNINFTLELLNAGVGYDHIDFRGRNIFHYLAEGSQNAVKDVFKKHTFNFKLAQEVLKIWDFDGMTPMLIAARENNTAAFQHFAQFGDVLLQQRDKKRDYTLLHVAAGRNNTYIIDCLLRRGMGVDTLGGDDATPLHIAVSQGNLEAAGSLLKAGANATLFLRENSILGLIPPGAEEKMEALIMKYVPEGVYQDLVQYREFSEYEDDEDDVMSD